MLLQYLKAGPSIIFTPSGITSVPDKFTQSQNAESIFVMLSGKEIEVNVFLPFNADVGIVSSAPV